MDQQLKCAAAQTRSVNAAKREIEAIVSDETIDSYGDSIDTSTWKLDRYRANPVVLFMHRLDQPIGRCDKIWIEGTQLHARMVLSETERAREVMQLFADGSLRGMSAGFRVGRITEEVRAGRNVTRLHDCELFEISCVSVPANPAALVKHKSLGLVPPQHRLNASEAFLKSALEKAGHVSARPGETFLDTVMRRARATAPSADDEMRERVRRLMGGDAA